MNGPGGTITTDRPFEASDTAGHRGPPGAALTADDRSAIKGERQEIRDLSKEFRQEVREIVKEQAGKGKFSK